MQSGALTSNSTHAQKCDINIRRRVYFIYLLSYLIAFNAILKNFTFLGWRSDFWGWGQIFELMVTDKLSCVCWNEYLFQLEFM